MDQGIMNDRSIGFFKILHQVLWIFALAFFMQAVFYKECEDLVWYEMWPVLPLVAVSFIVYYLARRFWIYLLFQPVFIAAIVFAPERFAFGLGLAYVVCVLMQLTEKKQGYFSLNEPSWGFCFVFAAIYFIGMGTERPGILAFTPYALMIYILLVLMFENMTGMQRFLSVRKNVENISLGRVAKNNARFTAGIAVLFVIMFALSTLFTDNSPLMWLIKQAAGWLKALFKFITKERGEEIPDFEYQPQGGYEGPDIYEPGTAPPSGNVTVNDALFVVAGVILAILFLIIFIKIMYELITVIMANFRKKKEEDIEIQEIPDEVVSLKPEKQSKKDDSRGVGGPSERVRRYYKKTVRKERKRRGLDIPHVSLAPAEIEAESFEYPFGEDKALLHETYEKARYSLTGVSEAEEKRVYTLARSIKENSERSEEFSH
jgi:hypothetical protein